MLYTIMVHLKNFFPTDVSEEAEYTIKDGILQPPFLYDGMYFLIEGSIFNDGVYKYPAENLTDETFKGVITVLAPPKEFLKLVEDIEAYEASDSAKAGSFVSESFGGYSYTKATTSEGNIASWKDLFKSRLNVWRKI